MNKRLLLGFVTVYAFTQLADVVIHQYLLDPEYRSLATPWRPEGEIKTWMFPLLGVSFSFFFYGIFCKAFERGGLKKGALDRFAVSMMIVTPHVFADYASFSVPFLLPKLRTEADQHSLVFQILQFFPTVIGTFIAQTSFTVHLQSIHP